MNGHVSNPDRVIGRRWPRAAIAAAAMSLLAAGCGKPAATGAQNKQAKPVPVTLAPAATAPVQRGIDVVGTLWADEDATISAKVAGKVAASYKDVGDAVRSGEPLLQIVPTDYALAKREKEMEVLESLAKIGLKEMPAENFDPVDVPPVRRAKLQAENAEARFQRGKKLFEQQPPRISEQDFEDLKTTWEVAKSNYDVELLNARATITEARTRKADLDIAAQRLSDTTVRAPAADSGTRAQAMLSDSGANKPAAQPDRARTYYVAAKLVSVGEFARDGSPVYRLVDDAIVKMRASVPERYAGQVRPGLSVNVNVEASRDTFAGKVMRVNPQVDPSNRTFEVEIEIPNENRALKPGSFARARILTRLDPAVVFVPQEAVVSFAGINKVFTIDKDSQAQQVVVTIGDRGPAGVEVISGLSGKESVVIAGNSKLAAGVKVEVKKPEATTAPAVDQTQAAATEGSR